MRVSWSFDPNEVVRVEQLLVARRIFIGATGPDLPYDIELEAVLQGDRMVARSVTCVARQGGQVTGEGLRQIPVGSIFRRGVAGAVARFSPLMGIDPRELRREGPTPETLKVVAAAYRLAYLIGEPPTAAVAGFFEMPRSTAARWVQRARESGLLGPAKNRRPGERRKKPPRAIRTSSGDHPAPGARHRGSLMAVRGTSGVAPALLDGPSGRRKRPPAS